MSSILGRLKSTAYYSDEYFNHHHILTYQSFLLNMNFLKSLFRKFFEEEISSLQKQIHSQQRAMEEKDVTISAFQHEKNHLDSQINDYNQQIAGLNDQVHSLQKIIGDLVKRDSKKQSLINSKKEQINEYIHQLTILTSSNNKLESLVQDQRQKINDNEILIQRLEDDLGLIQRQVESFNDAKASLEIQITELRSQLSEEKILCQSKEKEIVEKSNNIRAKEAELLALEESATSLKEEVKRLTDIVFDCKCQIDVLNSENNTLKSEKHELEMKLNELQNKQIDEELLTALRNDNKQKQENISSLEIKIQQLNEELSIIKLNKTDTENLLIEKERECKKLKQEIHAISTQLDGVSDTKNALKQAEKRIVELENKLRNSPTLNDLSKRDQEIESLRSKIQYYENEISKLKSNLQSEPAPIPVPPILVDKPIEPTTPTSANEPKEHKHSPRYRKPEFPYPKRPVASSKEVVTVDFPVIENDNVYSQTSRLIDKVFNHRSNSYITANEIFLHKSVEEISRMRFELEEASRTGVPYLTCPCCGNMVKISSRSVGFGLKSKEIQYFTHAIKNIPCDLKRDNSYTISIDNKGENEENDFSYLKELRKLLAASLRTELSFNKGLSDVKDCIYINSDELPIMKRRLADVTARYKDLDLVFELVTPATHIARVHDRDIFYLINRRQVFWVFGLESIVDYNELRRSVSKDIFFTNKRNVFVFDLEAQKESERRGELMLKCNWLDEEGSWYYQIEKNGKNGILVSIDQIHFEEDSCRPYFYDADEPYFLKHPTAERPLKLSRAELMKNIIEAWNYEQDRKRSIEQMLRENRGVEAYSDGEKWGFKFGETIFIETIFDAKPLMLGDFAKIEKAGKFGVVNKYGEYRLQPEYERVELIPNGYILYAAKGSWHLFGVIDPITSFTLQDEITISTISKKSSIYHLIIKKNLFKGQQPEEFYFIGNEIFKKNNISGTWSLWQSKGEKVTDITWDSIEFTSEDNIKVSVNGRTQLLALDGTVIEEQKYKSENTLSNGNTIVESFEGYWGIIDDNETEIVSPIYNAIIPIDETYLKFQKGNRWGIILSTGKIIAEPIYNSVDGFDGEYFKVTKPNVIKGWGYLSGKVDINGKSVSEIVVQTNGETSITKSFEKFGLETKGNILIPHIYDSLYYWGNNKYIAKKDGRMGIIDTQNNILIDFEWTSITPLKDGRSTISNETVQKKIDNNLKIVEDEVINLQEGYKKIKLGGKWGILDPQGQVIVDYLYDEISTFRGRLVGIINGSLIKLNAYYPYRLAMRAKNLGIDNSKDLVESFGVKFQAFSKRKNPTKGEEVSVILMNWSSSMKLPMVDLYDSKKLSKRARHIDKPTDFAIGDTFDIEVKSLINAKGKVKGKIKGVTISLSNGMTSYIYKHDFNASGIEISTVKVDDTFRVTKLGYDEELDRTKWRVVKIQ